MTDPNSLPAVNLSPADLVLDGETFFVVCGTAENKSRPTRVLLWPSKDEAVSDSPARVEIRLDRPRDLAVFVRNMWDAVAIPAARYYLSKGLDKIDVKAMITGRSKKQ